jgi:hypothetical protein
MLGHCLLVRTCGGGEAEGTGRGGAVHVINKYDGELHVCIMCVCTLARGQQGVEGLLLLQRCWCGG